MKYYSLNKKSSAVSFKEAVVRGIAPDKGLYFPETISPFSTALLQTIEEQDRITLAYKAIKQFVGDEIPKASLHNILEETLCFDFPLVSMTADISSLELYHGPTMAFKDVGARFMARCLGYFNAQQAKSQEVTVLVATSGDTGGAVASGFLGVDGVDVVILYPSGKVSTIQEKQLTTLGQNIRALEVQGTFDDCQAMVKKAFLDTDITSQRQLTSANSINVARWLPQMFYFLFAYQQLQKDERRIVASVPSGNYGNICAGMVAQKMGLPIDAFITGTNANKVVPDYLKTGVYTPKPSIATIANAMDVGDPSNFIRIEALHDHDLEKLRANLKGYAYTDAQSMEAMGELLHRYDYVAEPHGAIGYLALKDYLTKHSNTKGFFLATAHPVKFLDVLYEGVAEQLPIPLQIQAVMNKPKEATMISNYEGLKNYLI